MAGRPRIQREGEKKEKGERGQKTPNPVKEVLKAEPWSETPKKRQEKCRKGGRKIEGDLNYRATLDFGDYQTADTGK